MCFELQRVKGANYTSPSYQFVPCGKCAECRDMLRSAWSFRLRAELQNKCLKNGWHAGFITLTYNDVSLPTLPQSVFRSFDPASDVLDSAGNLLCDVYGEALHANTYQRVPCFDRMDVKYLIDGMRKYLHKHFDFKGLVYAVAGEYGSHTKRPHYHALFSWPSNIPDRLIYNLISDLWTGSSFVLNRQAQKRFDRSCNSSNKGFICPRTFEGLNNEKPFVCGDVLAAANYASKYLVKDIGFSELLNSLDIDPKLKALKRYNCFHVQTKSLGVSVLDGLSDDEKLNLFLYGYSFLGDKSLAPIPIYIKNKLLFTPRYIVDSSGKRLVRRDCTQFFKDNLSLIYNKKRTFYASLFEKLTDFGFYQSRGLSADFAHMCVSRTTPIIRSYGADCYNRLADIYLSYFGVKSECAYIAPSHLVWANRYDEFGAFVPVDSPLLSPIMLRRYNQDVSYLLAFVNYGGVKQPSPHMLLVDKVAQFHKENI